MDLKRIRWLGSVDFYLTFREKYKLNHLWTDQMDLATGQVVVFRIVEVSLLILVPVIAVC